MSRTDFVSDISIWFKAIVKYCRSSVRLYARVPSGY